MSAEQTPDIERVLAEHETTLGGACTCGAVLPVERRDTRTWRAEHVAQALAPVLAAAVREARAAAWDEGSATEAVEAAEIVRQGRDGFLGSDGLDPAWIAGWHAATDHHESRLRDRADRIAVDAPEGGEGR